MEWVKNFNKIENCVQVLKILIDLKNWENIYKNFRKIDNFLF
jgi:hypothetical protein